MKVHSFMPFLPETITPLGYNALPDKVVGQVGVEPTFIQLCTNRLEGAANTNPK